MAKSSNSDDIVNEKYRGPDAIVTGLGEGAAGHWALGLAGLLVGGALGFAFHGKVNSWVNIAKQAAVDLPKSGNFLKRWSAPPLKWLVGVPKGTETKIVDELIASHPGVMQNQLKNVGHHLAKAENGAIHEMSGLVHRIPGLKGLPTEKLQGLIAGGGVLGVFFGFIFAPIAFMFTGAKHAHEGKQQFERAQEAVSESRTQYDALSKKYADAKVELDQLKTTQQNPVRISADDTPKVGAGGEPPAPEAETPRVRDDKASGWTPEGKPEQPNSPQPPKQPWGEKVAGKANAANWQDSVRESRTSTDAGVMPR